MAGGGQQFKGANAGYTLLSAVVLGVGGGWLLDEYLDMKPLWTICLTLLFLVAGLYQVVKDNWPKSDGDA